MGLFGFVALQQMFRNVSAMPRRKAFDPVLKRSEFKNKYADEHAEGIIHSATRRALPHWGQGWFDICPVNDAAKFFGIEDENDAFRLLHLYHCVDKKHIPIDVRKRLPELIREALNQPAASGTEEAG